MLLVAEGPGKDLLEEDLKHLKEVFQITEVLIKINNLQMQWGDLAEHH
jgi:hypothetical protein